MPARHAVDVGADALAQVGDLVDERHLHGEEGVGGVLDELRRLYARRQDRRLDQVERAVEALQRGQRPLAARAFLRADHHAVGAHEVADGAALAQEFRVGGDLDGEVGARGAHHLAHLPPRADRDGGLRHQHQRPGRGARHLLGGGEDVGQVGVAVAAAGWRAHGEEHRVRAVHRFGEVRGEAEPPFARVVLHQPVEARLVDRDAALAQAGHLGGVGVHQADLDAEFREAGARDEADVAGPQHGDAHGAVGFTCSA
jgi:hypothetical protein